MDAARRTDGPYTAVGTNRAERIDGTRPAGAMVCNTDPHGAGLPKPIIHYLHKSGQRHKLDSIDYMYLEKKEKKMTTTTTKKQHTHTNNMYNTFMCDEKAVNEI